MKKLVVGFVNAAALVAVGMVAPAMGMDAPEQTFSNCVAGPYVNAGLGYSDVFVNAANYAATSASKEAFAWDALIGYQFNPYIALEASYVSFGYATLYYAGVDNVKDSLSGFGIDAKGIYSVNTKVDVFATVGVMLMHQSYGGTNSFDAFNAWTPDLGLGIAYNVTKNAAITGQDIYTFKNTSNNVPAANVLLAGVSYKINI
ncbi:MAG: outer membrane beta-barrel protein [Coxiellaceae bacterium]|nr:outer membrane beta-barrel protein [Coxiellaceae bacterium]